MDTDRSYSLEFLHKGSTTDLIVAVGTDDQNCHHQYWK
jgi:hypothetical protein